jgi:hypothetical protein
LFALVIAQLKKQTIVTMATLLYPDLQFSPTGRMLVMAHQLTGPSGGMDLEDEYLSDSETSPEDSGSDWRKLSQPPVCLTLSMKLNICSSIFVYRKKGKGQKASGKKNQASNWKCLLWA